MTGEKTFQPGESHKKRMYIAKKLRDMCYKGKKTLLAALEKIEKEIGEDLTLPSALADLIDPICSLVCEKVPIDGCEDETEEMWFCTSCGVDLPEINRNLYIPSSEMDMSCLCFRYCPECGSRIVSLQPLEEESNGSD